MKKREKISKGQKTWETLKSSAVVCKVHVLEWFFNHKSARPQHIDPIHILLTTNQIGGSANTHGHDEECRLAKRCHMADASTNIKDDGCAANSHD